jgi:hypothetical protein
VRNTIRIDKIIWAMVLTLIWICLFLFLKGTLVIDWTGKGEPSTNLRMILGLLGIIGLSCFNYFYKSNAETTKLSFTVSLTMVWLSWIIFYPFKVGAEVIGNPNGAVGFFALIGGLLVVILWVRFFSDEIFVSEN